MPDIEIRGGTIAYDVLGEGEPLVLTPGGRFSRQVPGLRPLAERLAERYRVLLWDRRNTGASSFCFDAPSESILWADDLAELLVKLKLAPAYVCGGSAGSRVSVLLAIRHPELVRKLALWLISGGDFGLLYLPLTYNIPFIEMARRGGMEAVAQMPQLADQLQSNPRNRDHLLGIDPEEFIATMKRWLRAYIPRDDTPMPGITVENLAAIAAPTLVFRGGTEDDFHPRETSMSVARAIPGARLVDPPWPDDEWDRVRKARDEGRGNLFDNWPRLAPQLLEFLAEP